MSVKAAIKYVMFGLCPGLRGKFVYFGARVYFPKASRIFRSACETQIYEPEVTAWLCRLAQPNQLFVDVGANIGLTSIPVLRVVSASRVLSFEPSPNSLPYLERTVRESSFRDRWEIVPKAAGESVGQAQFWLAEPEVGGLDGMRDTKRVGERHAMEVPQTTLDEEWRRLNYPRVSSIKIDVEGAETKVLKGAAEVIRSERPHILLEWNRENLAAHGIDVNALLDYASTHNYDLVAIPSLSPIVGVHFLRLHMRQSEMFLLIPKEETTEGDFARTA
jgi:FkbM family methyltransferase